MTERTVAHDDPVEQRGYTLIPNAVLFNASLTPQARMLYGLVKSFAWRSEEAWPGLERLAEIMCLSEDRLRVYVKELVSAGLLTVKRRGLGMTNLYRLTRIPDAASTRGLDAAQERDHIKQEDEVEEVPSGSPPVSARSLAQSLVVLYVDESKAAAGAAPTRKMIGQAAQRVGELLDAGHPPERIREGIRLLLAKGLDPTSLDSVTVGLATRKPQGVDDLRRASRPARECRVCGVAIVAPNTMADHLYLTHGLEE